MKVAIMQPYAFPYLGYFQLMAAVDDFVLLDDVAWIKGGWINRNRLADRADIVPFVFPVTGRSLGIPVDKVMLFRPHQGRKRFLHMLQTLYGRAPHYRQTVALIGECLARHDGRIADSVAHMLARLAEHLRIGCRIARASAEFSGLPGKGAGRIVAMCKALGATRYVNSEGGRELYRDGDFSAEGIELRFLVHVSRSYGRGGGRFHPRLSVIDALMFNSVDDVRRMLDDYRLVASGEAAA